MAAMGMDWLLAAAPGAPPAGAPANISPLQVGLGAAVVLVNAIVSVSLKLGIEWQLLVGAVRCVLQLTVLGYVLVPIFSYHLWWLVLAYSCFMLLVGAVEAASRPAYAYTGMLAHIVSCIGASSAAFLCYTLLLVVRTQPWWEPQYFIPILGMLLGNAVSGISIGLATLLEEFASGRPKMELLLSIGASRWEACRDAVARSVRVACMPIVNQMNVVGLVSIPGMMTGQILAGQDPSQAARYQMIVLFLIGGATSLASLAVILLAAFWLLDAKARLRADRLRPRERRNGPTARFQRWAGRKLQETGAGIRSAWLRVTGKQQAAEGEEEPLLSS